MEIILRGTPEELKELIKKEPCCNKALTKEEAEKIASYWHKAFSNTLNTNFFE